MIYVRHRQSSDADQENRIGGGERRSGADPDAAFDLHRRHLRGLSDRCVADPRDQGKFPLILTAVVFRGRHYPWRRPLVRSSNRFLYSAAVISVGVLLLACDYFCQIIYSLLRRTSAPGTYWPYPNVRRASASELIVRYIDWRAISTTGSWAWHGKLASSEHLTATSRLATIKAL